MSQAQAAIPPQPREAAPRMPPLLYHPDPCRLPQARLPQLRRTHADERLGGAVAANIKICARHVCRTREGPHSEDVEAELDSRGIKYRPRDQTRTGLSYCPPLLHTHDGTLHVSLVIFTIHFTNQFFKNTDDST
ncbi:hypothetical protein A0H81_13385 [Grifola frondosa]|uniref:Uncharacterized protein n=1 Tax=Grifola frondosa TaxID=5627 RepID=A0A1C7LP46_GRIFR|nr:hypothetical protein A0H81_13385 [Grifola frondosa]